MHHSSQDLRAWTERPTYGGLPEGVHPVSIPSRCTLLEEAQAAGTEAKLCQRSAKCTKPDGHPGFCVGAALTTRSRPAAAKLVRACSARHWCTSNRP